MAGALEESRRAHGRLILGAEFGCVAGFLGAVHVQADECVPVLLTPAPRVPPQHSFDILLESGHAVAAFPVAFRSRSCARRACDSSWSARASKVCAPVGERT